MNNGLGLGVMPSSAETVLDNVPDSGHIFAGEAHHIEGSAGRRLIVAGHELRYVD